MLHARGAVLASVVRHRRRHRVADGQATRRRTSHSSSSEAAAPPALTARPDPSARPAAQGGDLSSTLSSDTPPAWDPAGRQIALDITAALVFLHANSVTHRWGPRALACTRGEHMEQPARAPALPGSRLTASRRMCLLALPAWQGLEVEKRAADQGWAGQGGGCGHRRHAFTHLHERCVRRAGSLGRRPPAGTRVPALRQPCVGEAGHPRGLPARLPTLHPPACPLCSQPAPPTLAARWPGPRPSCCWRLPSPTRRTSTRWEVSC